MSAKEIAEKIKITQRAVQIFVKELQEADLVTVERRGIRNVCLITFPPIGKLRRSKSLE